LGRDPRLQDALPPLHGPGPGLLRREPQAHPQGRRRRGLRGRLADRPHGGEHRVAREPPAQPRRAGLQPRHHPLRHPVQQARHAFRRLRRGAPLDAQPHGRAGLRGGRRHRRGRLRDAQGRREARPHRAEEGRRRLTEPMGSLPTRTIALGIVLFFVSGAEAQPPLGAGIRGMTVGPVESSLQPGRGYGSEASAELLDRLVEMGVTWVSVTPFGRIWSLDSTQILMDFEAPYEENREGIKRFVRMAHARGLRVLLIPHLWVETHGWRGEIDPGSPERWAEYQASYREFVLAWARDAAEAGVEALSIGVECKSWSGRFPDFWASLIDEIRTFYPGLLTYSANWDEIETVVFWDLLDFVGINAFYPLVGPGRDTSDEG